MISSNQGTVNIRYGKIAQAGIRTVKEDWRYFFRFPFWKKEGTFDELLLKKKKAKKVKKEKEKSSSFPSILQRKIRKNWKPVLKSFQCERLELDVDTDDYIINAYLYPVLQFLSLRFQKPLSINFRGETTIEIVISNKIGKILYAFWK